MYITSLNLCELVYDHFLPLRRQTSARLSRLDEEESKRVRIASVIDADELFIVLISSYATLTVYEDTRGFLFLVYVFDCTWPVNGQRWHFLECC